MEPRPATTEVLQDMLAAVADGEPVLDVFSRFSASTGFSVSKLRTIYYRGRGDRKKHSANSLLSAKEDQALVYVTQAFSYANFALTRSQLGDLVRSLWGKSVGTTWARAWVTRHRDDLSARTCKALSDKRNAASTFDEVKEWVAELGGFLKDTRLPPWAVLNYDECRLVVQGNRLAIKRIQAADRERANVASTRGGTVASLLSFVAGDGAPFMSVYIFRSRFGEDDTAGTDFVLSRHQSRTRSSWPRFYGWTDTGFLDAPTFAAVMDLFCSEWQLRNAGRQCLLLGDQLKAHRQVEVVRSALKHGVSCWWLVANTSHFLQVLDDKCFACLKKHLPVLSEQKMISALLTNQSARDSVLQAAYEAERMSFTPTTIRASFRSVGLVPWDAARVMHLARVNLGLDLPSEGVADGARAAAAAVIRLAHDRNAADQKSVVAGRAVVQKRRIYSATDLLDADRARVAAEAAAAKAKAAKTAEKEATKEQAARDKVERDRQRVLATCRLCTSHVHRGGKGWTACVCGGFRVCPMCAKESMGKAIMAAHLMECSRDV